MPDGPSILWPENTAKSTPSAWKSTAKCGTDWQASSTVSAPTALAFSTSSETGLTVPSTFDWCANATTLVFGVMSSSTSDRSSRPSAVTLNHFSVAPVRWHNCCHGTRFAWCSISVMTISSPGPTRKRAASGPAVAALLIEYATRLMPSVAFLVNTSSSGSAPTNSATFARADS